MFLDYVRWLLCVITAAPGNAAAQRGLEGQPEVSPARFRPNAWPATHYSQLQPTHWRPGHPVPS